MKFGVVSLFSGCGGLDKGFELAGSFRVVWANDIYEPACKTFSKNFGLNEVKNGGGVLCGDVEDVDFSAISAPEQIDVVTGGPPCQDFSLIRGPEKRRGISVKRGRLYVHFVRALVALQPAVFVFENVRGLMSANGGVAFARILDDFKNLNLRWPEMWKNHANAVGALRRRNNLEGYEIIFSSPVDFSKLGAASRFGRLLGGKFREFQTLNCEFVVYNHSKAIRSCFFLKMF